MGKSVVEALTVIWRAARVKDYQTEVILEIVKVYKKKPQTIRIK